MKVRAKMSVQSLKIDQWQETAEFDCVYGGSTNAEDNTFASATPSGGMKLGISNAAVKGFFKPGRKYYVDITECPEEAQK